MLKNPINSAKLRSYFGVRSNQQVGEVYFRTR
jgi:hypothetical protein